MGMLFEFLDILLLTLRDVAPIVVLILFFQLVVIRQPLPHLKRLVVGGLFVVFGLAFFLMGLEKALFPIGDTMAMQLASQAVENAGDSGDWTAYYWIYIFAAMIGFSTTVAEPALIAVATKANEVSAGTISQWGLRITVALGVALALAVGTYRIVSGTPLHIYILGGYIIVVLQSVFVPKKMLALAYDSGGVTTSTVTVPLVAALGLGLSSQVPGSNPAVDGFGLIAFASVFPIISVLAYVQIMYLKNNWILHKFNKDKNEV